MPDSEQLKKKWHGYFSKLCKKYEVEEDLIDFEAYFDSSLTWQEQKGILLNMITALSSKVIENKAIDAIKSDKEKKESEIKEAYTLEMHKVEQEEIEKLKETNEIIKEKFKIFRHYVKMVAGKYSNFTVCLGSGGLGKSYQAVEVLNELNLKAYDDYGIISGYSTPLELFQKLYLYRDKTCLLIDDCAGLWGDSKAVSILKMATWSIGTTRYVSYNTTSEKLRVNDTFEMKAGIILIANEEPKSDKSFKALMTRANYVSIEFTHAEVIVILEEIAKKPYLDLSETARLEILEFIKSNSTDATEINLRTLIKAYDAFRYSQTNWKEIVTDMLKPDEGLKLIKELITKHNKMADAVREYKELTGKSHMSFYRAKRKLTN